MSDESDTEPQAAAERLGEPIPNETFQAIAGPAVYANRFYIGASAHGVRLAFAEQIQEQTPSLFRTALMLPIPVAMDLHRILGEVMVPLMAELDADGGERANGKKPKS